MRTRLMSYLQKTFAALVLCLASACALSPEVTFDPGTDFRLDLSATAVSVPPGGRASTGVQITWLGNCGCPDVQLTVAGAPSGMTPSFDAAATATGTTLFLATTSQVAPGTYRLLVTGTRGTLQHSQPLDVQVGGSAPDFALVLNPAFLSVAQGGSGVLGIEVQRTGGFAEAINLSLSGEPTGVTGTISGSPLGPQHAATAGPATLLLTVGNLAPIGPHVLTIRAASSSRVHLATFLLDIQLPGDFALALAPPTLTVAAGASSAGPVAVTLTRANGFGAAVAFSLEGAPAGCTGSFSPTSTTGNTASLGLALAGVAPGTYTLTVRGSAGALSHTATLLLTISAPVPDFGLPAGVSVAATQGGSGSTAVVLLPINGFSAPVTLSASGLPAGVAATFTPNPATPATGSTLGVTVPAAVAPGTYTGSLRGVSGALDHSTVLTLVVAPPGDFGLTLSPSANLSIQVPRGGTNSGTVSVQIQPSGGFAGPVTFTVENLPPGVTGAFSPNPASSGSTLTLDVSAPLAAPGTFTLTVRGVSGTLNHSTALKLTLAPPQDVMVTLNPVSGSCSIPVAGTSTLVSSVALAPVNGFSGSVNLGAQGLPPGVSATFLPSSAAVPGSSTMTLSITPAATPGTTSFTVEAVQGPLTATATFTLTLVAPSAPDFTVTPLLSAVTEQPGTSGTMPITVASLNGYSGPVAMSLQGAPAGMSGVVSPNPVTVPSGGSATTTLFLTTGTSVVGGVYPTAIRGAAGPLVHDAAWQVTVQDFTLAASPNAFSFPTGGGINGGGTLSITRLQGLANAISLSATLPGFNFVFSPPSTTGNSAGFTFTGPALAPAPAGVYSAVVTGNAGTWTRTTRVAITVQGFLITLMPSETVGLVSTAPPSIQVQTTPIGGTAGSATLTQTAGPYWSGAYAPNPVPLGSASNWTWGFIGTPGPGTFTYTVNGNTGSYSAIRNLSHTYTINPDFYLHVTDSGGVNLLSTVTLPAASSATLKVFLDQVNGFTPANGWPPAALTLSGAPAGLTGSFAPTSIDFATPSTLTLSASAGLVKGTYFVDVVGTAGALSHKATLLVIVP